jgi:hypothetical protein
MGKTNRYKSFKNFYEEDEWGSGKKPKASSNPRSKKRKQDQIMRDVQRGAYEDFDKLDELDDLYDD